MLSEAKHLCGFLRHEILHSLARVQNDKVSLRASVTSVAINRVECSKTFDCFGYRLTMTIEVLFQPHSLTRDSHFACSISHLYAYDKRFKNEFSKKQAENG